MKTRRASDTKVTNDEKTPQPETPAGSPHGDALGALFSKPPAPAAPAELSVEIEGTHDPVRRSLSPGFMSAREKRLKGLARIEVLHSQGMSEPELYLHKRHAKEFG